SVEALLKSLEPRFDESNVLIVEAHGEESAIIESFLRSPFSDYFDLVLVSLSSESLYAGANSRDNIEENLLSAGFRLLAEENSGTPLHRLGVYKANKIGKKIRRMETELQTERVRNKQLELELASVKSDVASQAESTKQFGKIATKIENLGKQIESYIGLNFYFSLGYLPPEMHGWSISPDFGMYLVREIIENDYDIVIECGSGSSTLLIAQSIARRLQSRLTEKGMEAGMLAK